LAGGAGSFGTVTGSTGRAILAGAAFALAARVLLQRMSARATTEDSDLLYQETPSRLTCDVDDVTV